MTKLGRLKRTESTRYPRAWYRDIPRLPTRAGYVS
jgi:hypothetical protein